MKIVKRLFICPFLVLTSLLGHNHTRAVRAMTEALKQNRLLKEQGENSSYHHTSNKKDGASDLKKDVCYFSLWFEDH